MNVIRELGLIEPSESAYAAPIVVAKNKSGEVRVCVVYTGLNKIKIPDYHLVPHHANSQYFFKLDLSRIISESN